MTDRRACANLAAAVAALVACGALTSHAQPAPKAKQLIWVHSAMDPAADSRRACFMDGLTALGWANGRNIAIEYRPLAGRLEALPGVADEVNRRRPDLLVVAGTPVTQAMQRMVREVPTVFMMVSDPVASGIVSSLARPGANFTGVSNFLPATTAKLLEAVKEAAPDAVRVAFLFDTRNPGKRLERDVLRANAPALGVTLEEHEMRASEDLAKALSAMSKSPPGALIVPTDSLTLWGKATIVEFAAKFRRPAIYQTRDFVEAGGLMSYGLDICRHYRQAATHADRVLKGAKPSDLPVEQPTTFEFVVNLKTARALGIRLPASLLARADRVIE